MPLALLSLLGNVFFLFFPFAHPLQTPSCFSWNFGSPSTTLLAIGSALVVHMCKPSMPNLIWLYRIMDQGLFWMVLQFVQASFLFFNHYRIIDSLSFWSQDELTIYECILHSFCINAEMERRFFFNHSTNNTSFIVRDLQEYSLYEDSPLPFIGHW